MSRIAITAAMVEEVAHGGTLDVPTNAVVTPLARDVARDRDVTLRPGGTEATAPNGTATQATGADLQDRVRAIVAAMLAGGGADLAGSASGARSRPVTLVRSHEATLTDFPHPGPPPGMRVQTGDVITGDHGAPMAAGYMTLTQGTFPWHLDYDEIQIVLEGELHIGTPQGTRIGKPGDIIYVPGGSDITFGTPTWTKFVYVTYPAEWDPAS